MSDKIRWRCGDTNPVFAAVEVRTVIEIGDLLWLDVHHAKPASQFNASATVDGPDLQAAFAPCFLGVAMQHSVGGDATQIRVATTGVFEFVSPCGMWELGDLIGCGVCGDDTLTLFDQQVAPVVDCMCAIARVAKREPVETHIVLVDIRSTVMTGGIK